MSEKRRKWKERKERRQEEIPRVAARKVSESNAWASLFTSALGATTLFAILYAGKKEKGGGSNSIGQNGTKVVNCFL